MDLREAREMYEEASEMLSRYEKLYNNWLSRLQEIEKSMQEMRVSREWAKKEYDKSLEGLYRKGGDELK